MVDLSGLCSPPLCGQDVPDREGAALSHRRPLQLQGRLAREDVLELKLPHAVLVEREVG